MAEKRNFNSVLKAEASKMVDEQGMTYAVVSRKLGLPKGTIGSWVSGYSEVSL